MALGARPSDLTRMVIGDGTRVVAAGIVLGVGAAVIIGRLIATLVSGVTTSDPNTFVLAAVSLSGAALAASYIPARRASRINPAVALRSD